MALQRTTEGISSGYSLPRESSESFQVRTLRTTFEAYPPKEQSRIKACVIERLRDELRRNQKQQSALARLARTVYGIKLEDL